MRLREPLYWGAKAAKKKEYYLKQLSGWEAAGADVSALSDFYIIKDPTNSRNLMDIIRISHWHRIAARGGDKQDAGTVIGIAADRQEAEDLAVTIVRYCYEQHKTPDETRRFPEGQVPPCILS